MDELISRANALKTIVGCMVECAFPDDKGFNKGLYKACLCVQNAPTVAAEPVRHARWEYREELQYFTIIEMMDCSVCGEHQNPEQVEAWAYCPNCGARMDLPDPAMAEKEDSR